MSAPTTSDPLVVTTADGTSWWRRAVTQEGRGLYAVAGVCSCPPYLMSTLAMLAEHGIRGQADALPMPVGPVPRSELDQARDDVMGACLARWEEEQDNARLRLALASAQRGRRVLRARVAELEAERHSTNEALSDAAEQLRVDRAAPATVYRASHDSIVMGHYATVDAAREHCEAMVQQEEPAGSIRHTSWSADDIGDHAEYELHITPAETGGLIRGTGYLVTPLEVASEYDEEADA